VVAIASFFFLPVVSARLLGVGPTYQSAWDLWQALAASSAPGSTTGLIAVTFVPAGAFVTFLIGCVGLVRPLPRLLLIVFASIVWTAIGLFCVFFLAFADFLTPNLGYFGLVAGYVCMVGARKALSQARKDDWS